MKPGLGIFGELNYQTNIECLEKCGINRTFFLSNNPDIDKIMNLCVQKGIICETLHAPFKGINDIWYPGEKGDNMLSQLTDAVEKCKRYDIPVAIIHVSSGRPMTPISEIGMQRYTRLAQYADRYGVKLAFENLRYFDNLKVMLDTFSHHGFCWDCGHQNCYTDNISFMDYFGDRLIALHIHDNRCIKDTDDHYIPFDGNIDFESVTRNIADSGYEGTMMLELSRDRDIYSKLTDIEYCERAAEAAKKLVMLVDKYRTEKIVTNGEKNA